MTPAAKTASGRCFCGAVRFVVEMPTQFCGHCHCSMCRRMHGAGYVTWFAVPPSQFRLTSDAADVVEFASSDHGTRSFCRRCGTSLFCVSTKHPDQFDIVLAAMDEPIDREPEMHIYFDDRASWIAIGDELPRLGGVSGVEPIG